MDAEFSMSLLMPEAVGELPEAVGELPERFVCLTQPPITLFLLPSCARHGSRAFTNTFQQQCLPFFRSRFRSFVP